MYHEEMESLVKHIPTIRRAQFWMSFSPNYLKHLEVLQLSLIHIYQDAVFLQQHHG